MRLSNQSRGLVKEFQLILGAFKGENSMSDKEKDIKEAEQDAWCEAVEVIDELYAEELGEQHDFADPAAIGTISTIGSVGSTASTISTIGV